MRKYAYILILLALSVAPLHADVKKESRHFLTTEAGIVPIKTGNNNHSHSMRSYKKKSWLWTTKIAY